MRLDPADVVAAIAILAILTLTIPKRDWRGLPGRLRETAQGWRRYCFGPPALVGPLSPDVQGRTLQLLRADLRRGFELGIPAELAAWCAESRGDRRRREHEATWRESRAGLTFRHLAGEMTEDELHGRLRERGLPLPAERLTWEAPPKLIMPPMEWRLDWERRLKELRTQARTIEADAAEQDGSELAPPDDPSLAPDDPPMTADPSSRMADAEQPCVVIHTLGEIRFVIDGRDVAPGLLHQPAQAFTVFYLLSREVRRPGDRVTRDFVGEESFRGLDPGDRRRGVRQRLANLSRQSPSLRRRIKTEGEYLSFDATGCDIDVCRLFRVAEEVKAARGGLPDELYAEARGALKLADQEYLPGWEGIESRGTLGGSGAADVIHEVRDLVVAAHLDILYGLADAALARNDQDEAIAHLERALSVRPERTALARRLADVYGRSGLPERAAKLREEYGLNEA